MRLKFKLLENRVTQLEREVYRLYGAIQTIAKKSRINLTETKDALVIPPYNPDLKDVRIKEGGRSKGGLNEMPTTPRPNPPKPMSTKKERANGKKRRK